MNNLKSYTIKHFSTLFPMLSSIENVSKCIRTYVHTYILTVSTYIHTYILTVHTYIHTYSQ